MRLSSGILLLGLAVAATPAPAKGESVDPLALIDEAMQTYWSRESYADMRAVLSRGLRDAASNAPLSADFAPVFAIYSDMARFEGNASFALQLAEEGLRLVHSQEQVDRQYENMLLVSRAYALADLGRYDEAVESSRIAAIWLGERFGSDARRDLESEISDWISRASADDTGGLPDAVQLAIDLLTEAETQANAGATAVAHALASRAMLPESTGLDPTSLRFVNAWSQAVSSHAFRLEGRPDSALRTMRRAADTLLGETWDGSNKVQLPVQLVQEAGGLTLVWDIFINIGALAGMSGQIDLATAALDIAEPFATTSDRRFSLLLQRGAVLLANADFAHAETVMDRSAADAREAGDTANAALAELYAIIIRLYRESDARDNTLAELVDLAALAANAAPDAGRQEFILTLSVHQAAMHGARSQTLLPLARDAFEAFRRRQAMNLNETASRDSVRRERRRFLETFIGINLDLASR